jgi:hypothetical protein
VTGIVALIIVLVGLCAWADGIFKFKFLQMIAGCALMIFGAALALGWALA